MLSCHQFVFNAFQENTILCFDDTGDCAIIDPGCQNPSEENQLKEFIHKRKLNPVCVLNTHGHIDHILGNRFASEYYNIPIYIHPADVFLLEQAPLYAEMFGLPEVTSPEPKSFLKDFQEIKIGNSFLQVRTLPGHSPGGVVFFSKDAGFLIAGDVLFHRSIGRTDLPGGNQELLLSGIREKLWILPDETVVWPGHNEKTTVGEEKKLNPFL